VDYWNALGWADPFSSPAFTRRQRDYARALGLAGLYTPQMVVSGRTAFLGSDGSRALRKIGDPANAVPRLSLSLRPSRDPGKIRLAVHPFPRDGSKVWVLIFENGLVTRVPRGENRGRRLTEDFVVRQLREIKAPLGEISFPRKVPNLRSNLGLAVLVQDPSSLEIRAAGALFPLER
jgi:hypothetical protein